MTGRWKQALQRFSFGMILGTLAVGAGPVLAADAITPVLARPLTPTTQPVRGTDGRLHLVYELMLTNAGQKPATLERIDVLGQDGAPPLASFAGAALQDHLRHPARLPVKDLAIEAAGTRVLLVDLALPAAAAPTKLQHRLRLLGAARGELTPFDYTIAPVSVAMPIDVLGPPLAGRHWVAVNGCCGPGGAHRSTGLPINGDLHYSQRYAIDWVQLDADGRFYTGDGTHMEDYAYYAAPVLAVADGVVVEAVDDMHDQVPGRMPDPGTINLLNIGGNHIVLDLGHGRFGFYAHLKQGSLRVAKGDRVARGQVLALLGNTGNTSAPHLHFHLMDSPSLLGSSGLPYVIDRFAVAGQLSAEQFDQGALDGDWKAGLAPQPTPREKAFPLDLTVVDFTD